MNGGFLLSNTPKVYFGIGSRENLFAEKVIGGKNVVLVTGALSFEKSNYGKSVLKNFERLFKVVMRVHIQAEPSPEDIDKVVFEIGKKKVDAVVAIGGGSVMDAGKAISAMLTVQGSVADYLEGVGTKQHPGLKLPFIALPTTSGTGSEATKNAVITKLGNKGYKKSLRHDNFVPNVAIIDPELMLSCPPEATAAGGMDAFTQLLESYLSTKANPFTDALALDGMKYIFRFLESAVENGGGIEAREGMAYAAYVSGITLANAGLGVVHGFAQPLGSLYHMPHGIACGTLMSSANNVTLKHILNKNETSKVVDKYAILGEIVTRSTGKKVEMAEKFIEYIKGLSQSISLPKLSEYGIKEKHFDLIIQYTGQKNHPVELSNNDLKQILKESL